MAALHKIPDTPAGAGSHGSIGYANRMESRPFRDLEWKRFEDVCQQFFEKKGVHSETIALGPDGGIDIRQYRDDTGRPTSIDQCKAWGERFVGVKPVRELLGVMTDERSVRPSS